MWLAALPRRWFFQSVASFSRGHGCGHSSISGPEDPFGNGEGEEDTMWNSFSLNDVYSCCKRNLCEMKHLYNFLSGFAQELAPVRLCLMA